MTIQETGPLTGNSVLTQEAGAVEIISRYRGQLDSGEAEFRAALCKKMAEIDAYKAVEAEREKLRLERRGLAMFGLTTLISVGQLAVAAMTLLMLSRFVVRDIFQVALQPPPRQQETVLVPVPTPVPTPAPQELAQRQPAAAPPVAAPYPPTRYVVREHDKVCNIGGSTAMANAIIDFNHLQLVNVNGNRVVNLIPGQVLLLPPSAQYSGPPRVFCGKLT